MFNSANRKVEALVKFLGLSVTDWGTLGHAEIYTHIDGAKPEKQPVRQKELSYHSVQTQTRLSEIEANFDLLLNHLNLSIEEGGKRIVKKK